MTDIAPSPDPMYLAVRLPFGRYFRTYGDSFTVEETAKFGVMPLIWYGGESVVLDALAVVEDEFGRRVYGPREFYETLSPAYRRWLDSHPAWPPEPLAPPAEED